jgi:YegS/Rv2252/BmrU family lipid kinase
MLEEVFGEHGLTLPKTTIILNPNSAKGSTGRAWPRLRPLISHRIGPFTECVTEKPGDGARLTREALSGGTDRLICVGGDGTLNEVVNGFLDESGPIRPSAVLGYLPRGTGCDFTKSMEIPREIGRALEIIEASHVRTIDVGRLQYVDGKGRTRFRFFHNIVSFGLGGEVNNRVQRMGPQFGGFLSFIWATVVSLLVYDKKEIEMSIDSGPQVRFKTWNIAVANGQYHGGGMRVAPRAKMDDGRFHITVVGDLTLFQAIASLPYLYNGRIEQLDKVSSFVGTTIRARSEQPVLLDVDGEQPGKLPIHIELLPRCLRIFSLT